MTLVASEPVPVLLYHKVGAEPSSWVAPYTVTAPTLARHLDLVLESGRAPITLSQLGDGLSGTSPLPDHPVVVTFDDGYADTLTTAAPLLLERGIPATVYVTAGFVGDVSPGGDHMLDWDQVRELAGLGMELGAHSMTHPQLDLLGPDRARREVVDSRHEIQDATGQPTRSFAYPHGYSNPRVRRLVEQAGFDSACSVKNALAGPPDTAFSLSRLMLTHDTPDAEVTTWLDGTAWQVGQADERLLTRAWRGYRRVTSRARGAA